MYTFEKTATGWIVYWGFAPEKKAVPEKVVAEKRVRVDAAHEFTQPNSQALASMVGQPLYTPGATLWV